MSIKKHDHISDVIAERKASAAADKTAQKYASLIEACEFGSESGAQAVLEIIAQRDEAVAALKAMLPDFESGYIANPSAKADRKRCKYENAIRAVIARAERRAQ